MSGPAGACVVISRFRAFAVSLRHSLLVVFTLHCVSSVPGRYECVRQDQHIQAMRRRLCKGLMGPDVADTYRVKQLPYLSFPDPCETDMAGWSGFWPHCSLEETFHLRLIRSSAVLADFVFQDLALILRS